MFGLDLYYSQFVIDDSVIYNELENGYDTVATRSINDILFYIIISYSPGTIDYRLRVNNSGSVGASGSYTMIPNGSTIFTADSKMIAMSMNVETGEYYICNTTLTSSKTVYIQLGQPASSDDSGFPLLGITVNSSGLVFKIYGTNTLMDSVQKYGVPYDITIMIPKS